MKEEEYFDERRQVEARLEQLHQEGATTDAIEAAEEVLDGLLDLCPHQLQLVWDNFRTKETNIHLVIWIGWPPYGYKIGLTATTWITAKVLLSRMLRISVSRTWFPLRRRKTTFSWLWFTIFPTDWLKDILSFSNHSTDVSSQTDLTNFNKK